MLPLIGLLHMACSACFLVYPRPIFLGRGKADGTIHSGLSPPTSSSVKAVVHTQCLGICKLKENYIAVTLKGVFKGLEG